MEITSEADGLVTVLKIAGSLNSGTVHGLEDAAITVIDGGSHRVILDMQAVDYVSSAGLRVILVAAKKAKAAGGGIALFGLQPAVDEVFRTCGFGALVPLAASDADARQILMI